MSSDRPQFDKSNSLTEYIHDATDIQEMITKLKSAKRYSPEQDTAYDAQIEALEWVLKLRATLI